jgi:predicted nucleotidyltransferase component of viral defense system
MKFLVITGFKDNILSVSPSVVRKAMEATWDIVNQARKSGGILEMYVIPGQNRVVSIQEMVNAEKMAEHFNKTPASALVDFEIYPLADMDAWTKSFSEALKSAEKSVS